MKNVKILLLAIVLQFGTMKIHAQYASLFGHAQTSWIIFEPDGFWGYAKDSLVHVASILVDGDTLRQVDRFRGGALINTMYIKEDTAAGKAWVCDVTNQNCQLFFDLSLEVGDAFAVPVPNKPNSVVDSVYYLDGKKHIRFEEQAYGANRSFEMVESVGTNTGLYSTLWYMLSGQALVCQHKENQPVFENPDFLAYACGESLSLTENLLPGLSVYPNPANAQIQLQLTENISILSIGLSDIRGGLLTAFAVDAKVIDLTYLENGCYFLHIKTDRGEFVKQVLLVK